MCGITGIVDLTGRRTIDERLLRAMNGRIGHRGPDGDGFHFESVPRLAGTSSLCDRVFVQNQLRGIGRFGYRVSKKIFFFCIWTPRPCLTPAAPEYFVARRVVLCRRATLRTCGASTD